MPHPLRAQALLAPMLLLAATLLPAVSGAAETDASAEPEVASPVVVEIVRGGGLAEVYRRDGAEFGAYGQDGKTRVETPQQQALQALADARDVQFLALDAAGQDPAACPAADCVAGVPVRGRVPAPIGQDRRLALEVLGGWLGESPGRPSTCQPDYRHALSFSNAGHAWEVLLSYSCGQYQVRRDGVELAVAAAEQRPGLAQINALFDAAGIHARSDD